jgi:hypothetical protein
MADLVVAQQVRDLVVARAARVAVRAAEPTDGGLGRLTVRFTRFGSWYEIDSWWEGRYLEQVARGAFAKTIAERGPAGSGQVKCLFDHGYDWQIGDKVLLLADDIREDDDYAVLEGDLFDTSYNRDLAPGLRAGAYGSSFMFQVIKDSWDQEPGRSEHNPEGLPERVITEIRLFEAGPVTWPANPAADAQLNFCRSDTDRLYELMARADPSRVAQLRQRVVDLRTAPTKPAGPATGDDQAAAAPADEPARDGHSPASTRAARLRTIREARLASLRGEVTR